MDRKQTGNKLDEWLDQALAEYGEIEPKPGLESRVLAGLHRRLDHQPWWAGRWRPVWMSAAVAIIFICTVMLFTTPPKRPAPPASMGNDQELLRGVDRLLNKEVPAALEPALVLTDEMVKRQ